MSTFYVPSLRNDIFRSRTPIQRRRYDGQHNIQRATTYNHNFRRPRPHARHPKNHTAKSLFTRQPLPTNLAIIDLSLEDSQQKSYGFTEHRTGKAVYRLLSIVAIAVFLFGVGVGVQGWLLNKQTSDRASAISQHSNDGTDQPDETPPEPNALAAYAVARDLPRYIRIASHDIEARVLHVGLSEDGRVDMLPNIYDTGWYGGSSKPGQAGALLIAGHVSGSTSPGVFGQLGTLGVGDTIEVERGDGARLTYVIKETQSYNANSVDMPKALAAVTPGKQGLNLMAYPSNTNKVSQSSPEGLIVFAERVK